MPINGRPSRWDQREGFERPPRSGSPAAQASRSTVAKLQPEGAEQGLTRASASSVAPLFLADAVDEEAEQQPSRAAARARHSAQTLGPSSVSEAPEEEAEQQPSRAAAPARHSAASLDPTYVSEHEEEEAEALQYGAVSGPSPRRGALSNVPEPLTKKKARHLLKDNERVIGYGAFF